MGADAIEHRRAQPFDQFAGGGRIACAGCDNRGEIGERHRLARTRGIDPLHVPGRQRTNVAVERERLGHAAKQMKAGHPRRLGIARNLAARQQCL